MQGFNASGIYPINPQSPETAQEPEEMISCSYTVVRTSTPVVADRVSASCGSLATAALDSDQERHAFTPTKASDRPSDVSFCSLLQTPKIVRKPVSSARSTNKRAVVLSKEFVAIKGSEQGKVKKLKKEGKATKKQKKTSKESAVCKKKTKERRRQNQRTEKEED